MALYGGIEAGGTMWVCALGTGPGDVRSQISFPTTMPSDTISRAVDFFRDAATAGTLEAIGIASFGPVDVDPASATYGYITTTPKPGWDHTDFGRAVERALGVPVGFDTDVNGAALAEYRWGAAQGLDNLLYLTIGTGIGGGAMVDGKPLRGLSHPEMGHMRLPHDQAVDPFPGVCPYHGDCWEGLANGPALERRWGRPSGTLPRDHPAWPLEAEYISLALVNLICVLQPQRIILGGGVMQQQHLFPLIRRRVQELLAGYLQSPAILDGIDKYIVPPGLGGRAGVLGAIALAEQVVRG
jgi:fructokinase